MLSQFIFSNLSFAISLFSALTFFSIGWLYLDSGKQANSKTAVSRSKGFFLLSLISLLTSLQSDNQLLIYLLNLAELISVITIQMSLANEPVLNVPKKTLAFFPITLLIFKPFIVFYYFLIYLAYRIKSTKGLEKQLKDLSSGFLFISISKLLSLIAEWSPKDMPFFERIFTEFGPFWITEKVIYIIGLIILFKWMWGYIRFRPAPQLFIIILTSSVTIFLTTTVLFSYLLLNNIENETYSKLKTDIKLFQFSIERIQEESISKTQSISLNSQAIKELSSKDKSNLENIFTEILNNQKLDDISAADKSGIVLYSSNREIQTSNSMADDPLFISAISDNPLSTLRIDSAVLSPVINIASSTKIGTENVILTNIVLDNAFVDGVKDVTGFDVTLFTGDTRSATTLYSEEGKRYVGTRLLNQEAVNKVLNNGEVFTGKDTQFGKNYYVALAPIKTYGGQNIGMVSVAKLQSELFEVLSRSLALTFAGSALLIALSLPIIYLVAKYIREQQEA